MMSVRILACCLAACLTDAAAQPQTFQMQVVGPDGKPVPEVTVEIRTTPAPTADWVKQGQFVKKSNYGAHLKTNGEGRLTLDLPQAPRQFSASVQAPGFGPYWAQWNARDKGQAIPANFTAELDAGWSVGGVVVDDSGAPVAGAKVRPSIEYKKPAGDASQLGVGTKIETDAAGKWRFDSVPESMNEVRVSIGHADFKPERRSLPRSEFGLAQDGEPTAKIALDRGLTVTGRVTDEAGKPIAGALVRTQFSNELRKATTDDDGVYRLVACEPRQARIVVSAKGRAMELKEARVAADMDPLDFQLRPGGKIRLRVVDAEGKPVPKARVLFQQ